MEAPALKVSGSAALKVHGSILVPEKAILPRRIEFVRASTGPTAVDRSPDDAASQEGPKPAYYLYPRDKLFNLLHSRPQLRNVGSGLQNAGNTCFFNSVLQTLTYTQPLQNYLLSKEHAQTCQAHTTGSFCALCLFERHAAEALQGGRSAVRPKALLIRLKELGGKKMQLGRQEDAHEFLRQFLDACHRSLLSTALQGNSVPLVVQHTTIIYQLFGGYLRSQVTCLECKSTSSTFDPFLDLSLEVNANASLEKALEFFTKSERLLGLHKYKCKRCEKQVDATKRFAIHSLPPVLTFQLKRFEYDQKVRGKILKQVSFPTSIDLARFTTHPEQEANYKLYAVIVHSGHSAKSGHYIAYARHGGGTWYEFNDEAVKPVSEQLVLRQQAYLLFYEATQVNGLSSSIVAPATLSNGFAEGSAAAQTTTTSPPAPTPTVEAAVVSEAGNTTAPQVQVVDTKPKAETQRTMLSRPQGMGMRMAVRSRRLRRLLTLTGKRPRRPSAPSAEAVPPLLKRRQEHAAQDMGVSPVQRRRRSEAASDSAEEAEVSRDARPPKAPTLPLVDEEPERQSVDDRVQQTGSYETQFGLAKVDRWDDDAPEVDESFKEAQRTLQPPAQQRDELDAEYDVGKRKHKAKKMKVEFLGKSAFDEEARRRHQAANSKGRPKGKGSGKGKGKGKSKGGGKGKGKTKFKG